MFTSIFFHVCVHFLILCGLTLDLFPVRTVTGLQVSHQMVQRGHGPAVESTVYHTLKYGYRQPQYGYHGGHHGAIHGGHNRVIHGGDYGAPHAKYIPHDAPVYQDKHHLVKSGLYHPNTLVYGRKVNKFIL